MDVAEFKRRLDEAIDQIKSCRKRPGVKEILVPGERSYRNAERNREQGVFIKENDKERTAGPLRRIGRRIRSQSVRSRVF